MEAIEKFFSDDYKSLDKEETVLMDKTVYMGMGVFPPSGRKIVCPDSSNEFMIEGEKIVIIKLYGNSGGVEAFLAALGLKAPAT